MIRVMVTGCSGFLAHHIIAQCQKRGWYVIGVDKRPIPKGHSRPDIFFLTDVRDLGFRDMMGTDYVIHLAFSTNIPNSVRHPKETTYDNIDMTIHMLEVSKEAGVKKFLFPSTASLYGNNPTPWTEDMKPDPIEPYSWQKLSLEYACSMYDKNGLSCAVFRFFQVFGEFQREDTALAAFLKAKKEGKPITLTKTHAQSSFKSGQRDFIYAGDIAKAVCMIAEAEHVNGIFNVASGSVHTMEEIAKAIGADVTWIPRREYEVERHQGDISKLTKLGWKPIVDVIEWLKETK